MYLVRKRNMVHTRGRNHYILSISSSGSKIVNVASFRGGLNIASAWPQKGGVVEEGSSMTMSRPIFQNIQKWSRDES